MAGPLVTAMLPVQATFRLARREKEGVTMIGTIMVGVDASGHADHAVRTAVVPEKTG
jgi:hypothetical protein